MKAKGKNDPKSEVIHKPWRKNVEALRSARLEEQKYHLNHLQESLQGSARQESSGFASFRAKDIAPFLG